MLQMVGILTCKMQNNEKNQTYRGPVVQSCKIAR
jgi:hypothetical protein